MENNSTETTKIAIVGSREYTNRKKIAQSLLDLMNRFNNLEIVSGGCPRGADNIVRELCIGDGRFKGRIKYSEFPPKHREWNKYCVLGPENYGQEYNVSNYFERNGQVAAYADKAVIGFIKKGVKSNGTRDTINKAEDLGRKTIIFY